MAYTRNAVLFVIVFLLDTQGYVSNVHFQSDLLNVDDMEESVYLIK